MAAHGSPAVARHRLRLALRRRREATGRTQGDVARSLDWSLSKLQRIEAGENSISTTDLQALLGQLEITDPGLVSTLVAEAKVARGRSRWDEPPYRDNLSVATKALLDFEASATTIRSFQHMIIPGLLQTREFATALFRAGGSALSEAEREVRLEVRLGRHERVLGKADHPRYMLILDRSTLCRDIGGAQIFARQLSHLMNEVRQGRVELRMVPYNIPPAVSAYIPFTVLTMPDDDDSLLYRETYDGDEITYTPERVQRYLDLFARLWEQSYPPDQTRRLIEGRISHLAKQSEEGSTT
jgi:transcriptional regulator with XRE-family HTH domain